MESQKALQAASDLYSIKDFLPASELAVLFENVKRGEEKAAFQKKVFQMVELIESMPVTYGQDGAKDPIVFLHYFSAGSDWYITEKDMDGGVDQAFGYAILNGDKQNAEMGYISIRELVKHGVELDLYFTPCGLSEIKAK